jgi:hypothetical protein
MAYINMEEVGKEINLKKMKYVNNLPVYGSRNATHALDYFEGEDAEDKMKAEKLKCEKGKRFEVVLSFVNYKKGVAGIVYRAK